MAQKVMVNGTVREVDGGKAMRGGVAYKIDYGTALVSGTAFTVSLLQLTYTREEQYSDGGGAIWLNDKPQAPGSYQVKIGDEIHVRVTGVENGQRPVIKLNGETVESGQQHESIRYIFRITGNCDIKIIIDRWSVFADIVMK